jgi:hypothetical protein
VARSTQTTDATPPQTPARPTASPRAQGTAVRRSGTQPKLVSTQSEPVGHALPDSRGSGAPPHGNGQGQDGGTTLVINLVCSDKLSLLHVGSTL